MVVRAGKLRPSQVVTQFGPGSPGRPSRAVDGARRHGRLEHGELMAVGEPRLQRALGVSPLQDAAYLKAKEGIGGIPARIFPRFLVCPRCNRLAAHERFEFTERGARHLCKAGNCRRQRQGAGVSRPIHGRLRQRTPRRLPVAPMGSPRHPRVRRQSSGSRTRAHRLDHRPVGQVPDPRPQDVARAWRSGRAGQKRLGACSGNRPWLADT